MDPIKRFYFDALSTTLSGVAHLVGPIHAPWTHKKVLYEDVLDILDVIQPADFIVTRTHGEMTTAAIPGYWKHAETFMGQQRVIGAVSPEVRRDWLQNLAMHTDNIAVLRIKDIIYTEAKIITDYAEAQLGKKYDFGLKVYDEEEQYCSEIAYHAINKARPGYVELWMAYGYPSFTPDDLWGCAFKTSGALMDVVYCKSDDRDVQQTSFIARGKHAA